MKKTIALLLILSLSLFTGCEASYTVQQEEVVSENTIETEQVKKNEPSEVNISDDKDMYDSDCNSVITMYLTVSKGNKADGSDHTWAEVNSYSAYDYEDMGVDRYKVEGLLKIDETGEGINKNSFGYDETVPNVSVQVRGQTSSKSEQKNYKIRIKDGKGRFRGQRTLNLNKHKNDPYRFINKLAYDLLEPVPQLIGGRTQFVHLYVNDQSSEQKWNKEFPTPADGEYEDYGLYTMVEQVNKTYMKKHGLDDNGHLYKVTFFEWYEYEAVMADWESSDFSEDKFNQYLEIKGEKNPEKLQEVLEEINNISIPIEQIVDKHFDEENLMYWMAFNILIGNYDVGERNLFLYSPLNSEKFYMICWDMDASFRRTYNEWHEYNDGKSWERGMTRFLGLNLIKRMMKKERYRTLLKDAVDDLYKNYVTSTKAKDYIEQYKQVTSKYLFENPDGYFARIKDPALYDELTSKVGDEIDQNYEIFNENMKYPWPFFVGEPIITNGELTINWEISYDYNKEPVTYDYILSTDPLFETDILCEKHGLTAPIDTIETPGPGKYFIRVTATNKSGYTMECFDYYKVSGYGKSYGCYCFSIDEKNNVTPYQ